jgi:hypothetical protein
MANFPLHQPAAPSQPARLAPQSTALPTGRLDQMLPVVPPSPRAAHAFPLLMDAAAAHQPTFLAQAADVVQGSITFRTSDGQTVNSPVITVIQALLSLVEQLTQANASLQLSVEDLRNEMDLVRGHFGSEIQSTPASALTSPARTPRRPTRLQFASDPAANADQPAAHQAELPSRPLDLTEPNAGGPMRTRNSEATITARHARRHHPVRRQANVPPESPETPTRNVRPRE